MDPAAVTRNYGFGIIARRWLGTWIDFAVLACLFLVPDFVLGNTLFQKMLPVWLGLAIIYFPLLETLHGRTLGKLLSGTVVVNDSGRLPRLGQSLVRTLLRIIEVNPLLVGGLPAGIIALMSRSKQRLGDMLARTYVITAADYRSLLVTSAGHATAQAGRRNQTDVRERL